MSEWGRTAPRRSGRGRSPAAVVLLAVLCIALGATGYFFLERGGFLPSVLAPQTRENEILAAERDAIAAELERLKSGGDATAAMRHELEIMRSRAEGLQSQLDDRADELGRAHASLELAQKVSGQLQSRLDLAEKVTAEMQGQLAEQEKQIESGTRGSRDEVEQLRQTLAQRERLISKYDEEFVRLSKVETELDQARKDLEKRREAAARLGESEAEISRLQTELQAARQALDNVQSASDLAPELNAANRTIADLRSRLVAAEAEQVSAAKRYRELETASAAMVASLKEELAGVRAKISELESQPAQEADRAARPKAPSGEAPSPRDPLAVAEAMRRSAGLSAVDTARRDRIATRLIEGECISKILQDEFGRAPAPTLRDLINALKSDC